MGQWVMMEGWRFPEVSIAIEESSGGVGVGVGVREGTKKRERKREREALIDGLFILFIFFLSTYWLELWSVVSSGEGRVYVCAVGVGVFGGGVWAVYMSMNGLLHFTVTTILGRRLRS